MEINPDRFKMLSALKLQTKRFSGNKSAAGARVERNKIEIIAFHLKDENR